MQIAKKLTVTEKVNWYQVLLISVGLFGYDIVSFAPSIFNVTNSQIFSIPFRAIFLALSIWVIIKYKPIKTNGRNIAINLILIFWVMYLMRMAYDTLFNSELIFTPIANYWLFGLGVCFIPMLAFRAPFNKATIRMALLFTFLICLLVDFLGLFQNIGNAEQLSLVRQQGNDYLNPISYGLAGGSLSILSLVLFINNRKKGIKAYLYLLAFPLGLWTLIIALSRGPIIDFLIVLILLFFNSIKSLFGRVISLIIIGLLTLSLVVSFDIPVADNIANILQSTGRIDNRSDETRLQLMKRGWEQFINHPVAGDLIEERTLHTYPHNLIIEAFMACGIFGGLLHVITLLKSVIQTNQLLKDDAFAWVGLLFVMQVLSSMFAGGIYVDHPFWFLLVLTNTLYFQQKLAKEKTQRAFMERKKQVSVSIVNP